jgi:hypothetical protein
MKRPARPFVVEVKKKRGNFAKRNAIWGDLDLSAFAADTSGDPKGGSEAAAKVANAVPVSAVERIDTIGVRREIPLDDGDRSAADDKTYDGQHLTDVEAEGRTEGLFGQLANASGAATNERFRDGSVGSDDCQRFSAVSLMAHFAHRGRDVHR